MRNSVKLAFAVSAIALVQWLPWNAPNALAMRVATEKTETTMSAGNTSKAPADDVQQRRTIVGAMEDNPVPKRLPITATMEDNPVSFTGAAIPIGPGMQENPVSITPVPIGPGMQENPVSITPVPIGPGMQDNPVSITPVPIGPGMQENPPVLIKGMQDTPQQAALDMFYAALQGSHFPANFDATNTVQSTHKSLTVVLDRKSVV